MRLYPQVSAIKSYVIDILELESEKYLKSSSQVDIHEGYNMTLDFCTAQCLLALTFDTLFAHFFEIAEAWIIKSNV